LRATLLPDGDHLRDLWIRDRRITFEPVDGAEDLGAEDSRRQAVVDVGEEEDGVTGGVGARPRG